MGAENVLLPARFASMKAHLIAVLAVYYDVVRLASAGLGRAVLLCAAAVCCVLLCFVAWYRAALWYATTCYVPFCCALLRCDIL